MKYLIYIVLIVIFIGCCETKYTTTDFRYWKPQSGNDSTRFLIVFGDKPSFYKRTYKYFYGDSAYFHLKKDEYESLIKGEHDLIKLDSLKNEGLNQIRLSLTF